MTALVADTSALVSIGASESGNPSLLDVVAKQYEVIIPGIVLDELERAASFDDRHAEAASSVLSKEYLFQIREAETDVSFPLGEGENAAVSLANEVGAEMFLCDEFNALPLIHASLTDSRTLTTPTLLRVLLKNESITSENAVSLIDRIGEVRSWEGNSYVKRVRQTLLTDR